MLTFYGAEVAAIAIHHDAPDMVYVTLDKGGTALCYWWELRGPARDFLSLVRERSKT